MTHSDSTKTSVAFSLSKRFKQPFIVSKGLLVASSK